MLGDAINQRKKIEDEIDNLIMKTSKMNEQLPNFIEKQAMENYFNRIWQNKYLFLFIKLIKEFNP